jgi:hypothetical protein
MSLKYLQMIAHALVLVAVMLGLIAAALWFRLDQVENKAQAQMQSQLHFASSSAVDTGIGTVDPGRQRVLAVEQLDALNKRIADLEKGFRDGSYSIQVIEPKGAAKQSPKDDGR